MPATRAGRIVAGMRLDRLRDLRLPPAERPAARAERRTERALRRERENVETAERRAAAVAAEARRHSIFAGHPGTHIGNGG